jgi:cation/acetate symporter
MAGLSFEPQEGVSNKEANAAFKKGLNKVYGWYTGGFMAFVVVLAIAEQMGLSRGAIGIVFLIATVALYAGIAGNAYVALGGDQAKAE